MWRIDKVARRDGFTRNDTWRRRRHITVRAVAVWKVPLNKNLSMARDTGIAFMKIKASLLYSVLYYNILDLCNDCFKAGKRSRNQPCQIKSLPQEKR